MNISGIIFDLDDTLYDCTGTVFARVVKHISTEIAPLLNCSPKKVFTTYQKILKQEPNVIKATHLVCKQLGAGKNDGAICSRAEKLYFLPALGITPIKLFPHVGTMLLRLRKKYKLGLVTFGGYERQNKKIDALKLRKLFHFIGVDQYSTLELTKRECFEDFLKKMSIQPADVICIGDKVMDEIKIANQLGMTTVRVLQGRYAKAKPVDDYEIPDYTVKKVTDAQKLIQRLSDKKVKA